MKRSTIQTFLASEALESQSAAVDILGAMATLCDSDNGKRESELCGARISQGTELSLRPVLRLLQGESNTTFPMTSCCSPLCFLGHLHLLTPRPTPAHAGAH